MRNKEGNYQRKEKYINADLATFQSIGRLTYMSELLLLHLVTLKTPFIMPEEFCFGCNAQIPGRHSVLPSVERSHFGGARGLLQTVALCPNKT